MTLFVIIYYLGPERGGRGQLSCREHDRDFNFNFTKGREYYLAT
jgi:hypothetical protein